MCAVGSSGSPQPAVRLCTKGGWQKVDLSDCIHQEFMRLSSQVKTRQESWILIKKARETIEAAESAYSRGDFFVQDIEAE